MDVDEARERYERAVTKIRAQHRYVADAQLEAASRAAILPDLEWEAAWAKGCLDSAEGRTVDWDALRAQRLVARDAVETSLAELQEIRMRGRL